jgi:LysM repeat protein
VRSSREQVLLATCGVALAVTTLLTACTETDAKPATTTPAVRTSSPAPMPTTAVATSSATSNPTFLRDPEIAPWGVTTVPDEVIEGNYTNDAFPVQLPRDGGPIEYAEGTPIKEGSKLVAYTVASGDIYDYIAKRFHLTNDGYLLILNEVRRGEAAQLYAGDVLNLSAYTLHEYGTVDGRVVEGPQPVTAPRQWQ